MVTLHIVTTTYLFMRYINIAAGNFTRVLFFFVLWRIIYNLYFLKSYFRWTTLKQPQLFITLRVFNWSSCKLNDAIFQDFSFHIISLLCLFLKTNYLCLFERELFILKRKPLFFNSINATQFCSEISTWSNTFNGAICLILYLYKSTLNVCSLFSIGSKACFSTKRLIKWRLLRI